MTASCSDTSPTCRFPDNERRRSVYAPEQLRGVLAVLTRTRVLGVRGPFLVPVSEPLRQGGVLLEAARPLHKLLVRRLLLERTRAQQLQHVRLVQNLLLQEAFPHLRGHRSRHPALRWRPSVRRPAVRGKRPSLPGRCCHYGNCCQKVVSHYRNDSMRKRWMFSCRVVTVPRSTLTLRSPRRYRNTKDVESTWNCQSLISLMSANITPQEVITVMTFSSEAVISGEITGVSPSPPAPSCPGRAAACARTRAPPAPGPPGR